MYVDKAKGILTEKHFLKLTDATEKEKKQESNQNRILIGESKKTDGVKTQEVRIVYNFVGEL